MRFIDPRDDSVIDLNDVVWLPGPSRTARQIRSLQGLLWMRERQRAAAEARIKGIKRRLSELEERRERELRGDYSDAQPQPEPQGF
jgi:hypothetical protein